MAAATTTSGYAPSGLVAGDTIGSVSFATNATSSSSGTWNAGSWTITPSGATGGTFNATNYAISYNAGALTVNQALRPTIATNNQTMTYGGNNLAAGYTPSGRRCRRYDRLDELRDQCDEFEQEQMECRRLDHHAFQGRQAGRSARPIMRSATTPARSR